MKIIPVLSISAVLVLCGVSSSRAQDFGPLTYGCPPCGCPGDAVNEAQPGPCPVCSMAMTEKPPLRNVAFLIYDHMHFSDFAGAFSVFENAKGFTAFTVAPREKAIRTHPSGMTISSHFTLTNSPPPDVIIIPGGSVGRISADTAVTGWIRRNAGTAKVVISISTGAILLAKSGLLDGETVTVTEAEADNLKNAAPKANVVTGRKLVQSGKFMSAEGPYSGVDASLHLLKRIFGSDARPKEVAEALDYRWVQE